MRAPGRSSVELAEKALQREDERLAPLGTGPFVESAPEAEERLQAKVRKAMWDLLDSTDDRVRLAVIKVARQKAPKTAVIVPASPRAARAGRPIADVLDFERETRGE